MLPDTAVQQYRARVDVACGHGCCHPPPPTTASSKSKDEPPSNPAFDTACRAETFCQSACTKQAVSWVCLCGALPLPLPLLLPLPLMHGGQVGYADGCVAPNENSLPVRSHSSLS